MIRSPRLSIVVSPTAIAMCLTTASGRMLEQCEIAADIDFAGRDLRGLFEGLEKVAREISLRTKRADIDLRVALPDTCFQQTAHSFDEFPKRSREARELVSWQHCNALRLDPETSCVGYQVRRRKLGAATEVLAQSAPKDLVDTVCEALWDISLSPTRIDGIGNYLLSAGGVMRPEGRGVFLWYGKSWWAFRLLDAENWSEPVFSSWRNQDDDPAMLIRRLKRVVQVQNENSDTEVKHLHVTGLSDGNSQKQADIASALNIGLSRTEFSDWASVARIVAEVR